MPKVEVNGVNIYYEWHGPEDAPVLALVNGVLMSTKSWAFQIPALSQHYRLLLHDCRGQGQSDHPREPYTMLQHAADLAALLDALLPPSTGPSSLQLTDSATLPLPRSSAPRPSLAVPALGFQPDSVLARSASACSISETVATERRAHIAGISYGGEIAQLLAIHYPDKVRSLFLSSTVSEVRPLLRAKVESWIAAAKARSGELLYRCSVTDNFAEPWLAAHPDWAELSIPRYEQLDFDAVVNLCESFLGIDCTADLPKITALAMVVVGELDRLKPLDPYARLITSQIPGAQLVILGNAGHACCIETPSAWNAALLGWLAQLKTDN